MGFWLSLPCKHYGFLLGQFRKHSGWLTSVAYEMKGPEKGSEGSAVPERSSRLELLRLPKKNTKQNLHPTAFMF